MLRNQVDARALTLALGGRWHKGRYGLAFCPSHWNSNTPALTLGNGRRGALILKCHAGCSFRDVLDALKERGLLDGVPEIDQAELERRAAAAEEEQDRKRRYAASLWRSSIPIDGTPAEAYLLSRAIRPPWPASVRFGSAWCDERGAKVPTMISAIERCGQIIGVHRTFLADGLTTRKAMLGSAKGGAVRLSAPSRTLVICEGIETGLSLRDGLPADVTVWAALSVMGMAHIELPDVGEVVVAPDGDPSGRNAAAKLADRCFATGVRCRIMKPPDGLDWNDVAQAEAMA